MRLIITLILFYLMQAEFIANKPIKAIVKNKDCGYEVIGDYCGIDCNGNYIDLERIKPHGWMKTKKAKQISSVPDIDKGKITEEEWTQK